ncbi:hypothetical protein QC826_22240 [Rugamonas sp. DEMB1]|nr:hypothetical protein [Rugamonas sp. DEMB1]WGG49282.1 hypothetical protein QC826_22240 [Rugamonas sp. DEMB1]
MGFMLKVQNSILLGAPAAAAAAAPAPAPARDRPSAINAVSSVLIFIDGPGRVGVVGLSVA